MQILTVEAKGYIGINHTSALTLLSTVREYNTPNTFIFCWVILQARPC